MSSFCFVFLVALTPWLQFANARTLACTQPTASNSNRSTASVEDARNATVAALPAQITKPLEQARAVRHIVRHSRDTKSSVPFDFNTRHLPCDFDQNGRHKALDSYPNHCVWIWNNRYSNEKMYRFYKTYQLEAFFFGQYYERLKRFEVDPHSWDYTNIGV
ncbi:uncharacterized protein LOC108596309 isoform X2 [Drosophila busckii]|uniref:uncharacterized protein LOC108596309 isoform X2 n=1 Tax=Drosophila busckii TaxID=30019 RepID=UPI00083ED313|nr:uncharacterized protein LOC108596309 isoform X2 [Drosophila busckii]